MTPAIFADHIFDALQEFDRSVQPFGLYAAGDLAGEEPQRGRKGYSWEKWQAWKMRRDHPEAEGAVAPLLANLGYREEDGHQFYHWNAFTVVGLGRVNFHFERVSKIKVRQYGSKYHVDKHENFDERWNKMQMDKAIAALCNLADSDIQLRVLLFLGFDRAQRPFERELSQLKPHQTRERRGIEHLERAWDDAMGRGFKVKVALWMCSRPE